ncbi:DUF2239 family protein [Neoroseomonas lacus]|uniref:DUF2239 family protein n=1 Tax=Neoroseomonas lacus TaxID=287609 RepID=A0A917KIU6_9PROT|nr:DUF2239 family protein [Neoroseomonas lacus]GGJ15741.1 hypothetical protein GCM10011320_23830 [Neoroseomonas lacus]
MTEPHPTVTAFQGFNRLARGALAEVALAVRGAQALDRHAAILVFDDRTGAVVDLDLRGDADAVRRRYALAAPEQPDPARGRGRPKLGVIAREVTLLPRHWDWLATQPGGASAALRRLVEQARLSSGASDAERARRDAAYRVMAALAGDLPGFEDASRALFAKDRTRFEHRLSAWPDDLQAHLIALAFGDARPTSPGA